MVSIRCKMVVKAELDRLGVEHGTVEHGEVHIKGHLPEGQRESLRKALLAAGLELMEDKKAILIEKIKHVVIEMVHYMEDAPTIKNSDYLSEKLHHNYTYLANLFSEATGMTIEHFIIIHKIERVKELLMYSEHTLTEISYLLHYSSVAHLSTQFKKVTGLTPSFFKELKEKRRLALAKP
jgi:AraC-like DNA-binding protein